MGIFVSVRGFLQCDEPQLAEIGRIIQAAEGEYSYNGAWAFPQRHYNWVHYVFYGADIPASAVDPMLELLRTIARVPPTDEDNDRVTGLFLASHEVDGMAEWRIRGGGLRVRAAGDAYRYLDE